MNNNFKYSILLPNAEDVLVAQSGSNIGTYSLKNIKLEYEVIDNFEKSEELNDQFGVIGTSLFYEHLTLARHYKWASSSTDINDTINNPRKSMKAIVMLFTKTTKTDSEAFIYPNIESVSVSIEGVSNSVYSEGITKDRLYEEAERLFCNSYVDQNMTIKDFYKDKFALVIDLRSHSDRNTTGNGRNIVNTQSGVQLEIRKKAHSGTLECYVFVLSDGIVNFTNNNLDKIQY